VKFPNRTEKYININIKITNNSINIININMSEIYCEYISEHDQEPLKNHTTSP